MVARYEFELVRGGVRVGGRVGRGLGLEWASVMAFGCVAFQKASLNPKPEQMERTPSAADLD